jgi:hypothetical protein
MHIRFSDVGKVIALKMERTMLSRTRKITMAGFLNGLLVGSFAIAAGLAQSSPQTPAPATNSRMGSGPSRFQPNRFAGRAGKYYQLVWGVDALSLKTVESGEIIRFAYQVLDPEKAKILNDKKFEPSLIDPQAGVKLVVPAMEQVGILRQSGPPEAGKFYWMAFSNSGRRVKRNDRVNIVIGQFHADGLVVD